MRGFNGFLALIILAAGVVMPSNAASGLITCTPTGESPLLRGEGLAERVGDILINCTGGDPRTVNFLSLTLVANANITSRLVGPDRDELEALLLIDEPLPGKLNTSNGVTYAGQVKGEPGALPGTAGGPGAPGSGNVYTARRLSGFDNRIRWDGIPFRPAPEGRSRVLRISNLRIDASQLRLQGQEPRPVHVDLLGELTVSIWPGLRRTQPGYVVASLDAWLDTEFGRRDLVFEERFSSAFKKRIATGGNGLARRQGVPGTTYATESGLTPEFSGLDAGGIGAASTGTRFLAVFDSLPEGVYLTAPSSVRSDAREDGAGLEIRRVTGFNEDFTGGELLASGAPVQLVPAADGQARLVYEVVAREPFLGVTGSIDDDRFRIPITATYGKLTELRPAAVTLSYAPIDPANVMNEASPAPRFPVPVARQVVLPLGGYPALDYVRLEYRPSDPVPLTRYHVLPASLVAGSITVIGGEEWLSAEEKDVDPPRVIEITADPAELPAGRRHGAISFRLEGQEDELQILPVILDVNPPPAIAVDTAPLVFRVIGDDPPPEPRRLFLNGKGKWLDYEIGVSTETGGDWLSVTPAAGRTPVHLAVSVDTSGLPRGRYEGAIEVRAVTADNSPQTVPVVLELRPPTPVFGGGGVVNAASYWAGAISPGELVTIFGSNVGPPEPAGSQLGPDGRLTTEVAGTRILFDGFPGRIVAVSQNQSSATVPYSVRGKAAVPVEVEIDGWKSDAVTVPVRETSPGIFTADASGKGQGAIINQDGTRNSPSNPAAVGSVVSLYATGAGETVPGGVDGAINPASGSPMPLAPLTVRIGGVEARVEFAGGAPGSVAGVIQINVRVTSTPGAAVPVQVRFGGSVGETVYVSVSGGG